MRRDSEKPGKRVRVLQAAHLLAVAVIIAGMNAMGACADFDAPPPVVLPDTLVANPSFARDIQPIFTKRCATASCHTAITRQGNMALDSLHAYGELVNVTAVTSDGMSRVAPYDAADSWLVRMIAVDSSARNNLPRMPLGRTPLTDKQIATIVNWINQGAKQN